MTKTMTKKDNMKKKTTGSHELKKNPSAQKVASGKSAPKKIEAKKGSYDKKAEGKLGGAAKSSPKTGVQVKAKSPEVPAGKGSSAQAKKEKALSPQRESKSSAPQQKGESAAMGAVATTLSSFTSALVASEASANSDEIILTDAEGRRLCRVRDCDQAASVDAYCRFHYLLLWKKIQVRKKIIQDGKLERYVEELTSRYPDKFLEMIKKDLRSEKDFLAAIAELEIDESGLDNDFEDDNYMDDVRGVSTGDGSTSLSEEEEF